VSARGPDDDAPGGGSGPAAPPAYAPGARVPVAGPATHLAATPSPKARASLAFVALLAALGAINAFATDIVIPVLGDIAADLDLEAANRRQWIVYAVFLGMAVSQLLIGPISDRHGRRKATFLGMAVYLVGAGLAAAAPSFELLLAARALQGLGSGGMRVMVLAITRDRFAGDEMSRIFSLSTALFVLMVLLAPFLGEWISRLGTWRWVFAFLAVQVVLTALWFALAQPETLKAEHRRPLRVLPVLRTLGEVLATPASLRAALALAVCFGAFAAYLGSAQQVFGGVYGLEDEALPAAFAVLALAYGAVSLANAALVRRLGAGPLARAGLAIWVLTAGGAALLAHLEYAGAPPLWLYLSLLSAPIGVFALLYGNLLSLALAPMGDKAGSAASAVSALSAFGGALTAAATGALFDGTVVPLLSTFAAAGALGLVALGPGGRRR